MKYLSRLILALSCLALVASPAFAQGYGPARTSSAAVAGTTTGAGTAFSAAGSTAALIDVYSASTSSGTVKVEFSIDGVNYFPSAVAVITDPAATGEMWACAAAPYMRTNITAHASGTITGKISFRTMLSDPIVGCKKVDTFGGFTFASGSGTFNVSTGKTAAITQSITLAGTDAQTYTFPTTSATVARTDAANTFTGTQTFGTVVATTVNGHTFTAGSSTFTGTAAQTYTFPSTTATIARTDAANTFTGTQSVTTILGANHFKALSASPPTVTGGASTCGTTAAAIAGGDAAGTVTVGSVGGTACVVSFGTTYTNVPPCSVTRIGVAIGDLVVTNTATTLTATATFGANEKFHYNCTGY